MAIVIHGGYWRARYDLTEVGHLCEALTRQGLATWRLEYRRIGNPGGGWPGTLDDVRTGAAHLEKIAAERSLDLKRVQFFRGNWFEPLAGRTFDLILSNPPYVAEDDPAMQDPALRYEPRGALTPGGDGMGSLRAIIAAAPDYLERDGWLLLEHGSDQAAEVTRELVARGLRHVRSHRDLAGHERMTEAQRG